MNVLKCKICGGDIDVGVNNDITLGVCQYCGSTITLPRITEERRAEAFNRGNYYRRIGEFDNALSVYEQIISEDPNDAEAHWCAAISRFGIEYVEDPTSMEYLPTCHRVSYESFLDDIDYQKAVELSDGATKRQYMKDAAKISEVQNGILAKSQLEDPFDIFICYKESDENGRRTQDSVDAQEVFYQLKDAGYKVFFARITLEDKVGTEYEPYIFSALNTSKVMIVIGSTQSNLDSVWVKNEWSRFIAMMKNDRSKVLLPCYKNMSPYDMPQELSVLQSYDMTAIGFMQDLLHGISKIIRPVASSVKSSESKTPALFERGKISLRNREWNKARTFFDEVLNTDPQNADAYTYLLLVEKKCRSLEELSKTTELIDKSTNYKNALEFADDELKNALVRLERIIRNRRKVLRKKRLIILSAAALSIIIIAGGVIYYYRNVKPYRDTYANAVGIMNNGDYDAAIDMFVSIADYKDSEQKISECSEEMYKRATESADSKEYEDAMSIMNHLLDLGCLEITDEVSALYNNCYYEYYDSMYRENNTDDVAEAMLKGLREMRIPRETKCENLFKLAASRYGEMMKYTANAIPELEVTEDEGHIVLNLENLTDYPIKKATISYKVSKAGGLGRTMSGVFDLFEKTFFVENVEPHGVKQIDTRENAPTDSSTLIVKIRDYDLTYDVDGMDIRVK